MLSKALKHHVAARKINNQIFSLNVKLLLFSMVVRPTHEF